MAITLAKKATAPKSNKSVPYSLVPYDLSRVNPDRLTFFHNLLKKMQEFFPSTIIAGGSIRDLIFNKDFKDVDFFISDLNKNLPFSFIIDELIPEAFNACLMNNVQDGSITENVSVYRFQCDDDVVLDIIHCNNPISQLRQFDFSINQAALKPDGLVVSNYFLMSAESKLLYSGDGKTTLNPTLKNYTRYNNLKVKYPEFSFAYFEQQMKDMVTPAKPSKKSGPAFAPMNWEQFVAQNLPIGGVQYINPGEVIVNTAAVLVPNPYGPGGEYEEP